MDFIDFKIIDIIDITVVALLLVQIYRMIRGTAALTIFVGVFIVYLLYVTVRILNMELLSKILGQIIGVGAIALVIVFQQEIRRYLLLLGTRISNNKNRFLRKFFATHTKAVIQTPTLAELSNALLSMSQDKCGALIAIEKTSDLSAYVSTGDIVDATISSRLVEAIFFKNSPMHDGAMIITQSRIFAARCILPTSDNPTIPAHLGLRHRAAIGLSEHTDALVIVVSEETGRISIVEAGNILTINSQDNIVEIISDKLSR